MDYLLRNTLGISVTPINRKFSLRLWDVYSNIVASMPENIIQSFGLNARRTDSLVPPTSAPLEVGPGVT